MRHGSARLLGCVTLAVAALWVVAVAPASASVTCTSSGTTNVTVTCTTGTGQWVVPNGVTQATFDVLGAAGGSTSSNAGGAGGHLQATLAVTAADTYDIQVGGAGGGGTSGPGGGAGAGGNPGGAEGGVFCFPSPPFVICVGGGGGGGTSLVGQGDLSSPSAWQLVAGGGGGGGQGGVGGAGGDTTGGDGGPNGCAGTGGDQTGATGSGTQLSGSPGGGTAGGGGGGGFYGGAGSTACGAGGGSGFITPAALAGSGFLSPSGSGDGLVTITYTILVPVSTGPPQLKNASAPLVGAKVGTTAGRWAGSPTSYSYQWMRCDTNGDNCADIVGKTGNQYVPTGADENSTLRSRVVAHNANGDSDPATSAPSGVVTNAAPTPVKLPQIKRGSAPTVGVELASNVGTWTDSPTSYSRQWRRCDSNGDNCADITGKTGVHYTPTNADVGSTLRISVIAHGTVGDSLPAESAPTGVVS